MGLVLYVHGPGIDAPLAVLRSGMSDYQPAVVTIFPHANSRGEYTNGSHPGSQTTNVQCAGNYGCPAISWPGAALTVDGAQAPGTSAPVAWVGSLLGRKTDGSGLQYLRNRYYDPATGKFTQVDPIGLAGGLNLYGFANGDAVNFSDPFGLCPMCVVAGAWALYEAASGAYDLYKAAKTVADPDASAGTKALTVGLAALSVFGPGGGYTGAVGLTKTAARGTLGQLGVEGAQRAAANRAIGRATSKETIDVLQAESGDVVVRLSRPGRDGHQVIESTIKPDGSKSVVQRAYDARGNLVHEHPKTP